MNETEFNRLVEESWRRQLAAEERAGLLSRLAADPQAQARWDEETALNGLLRQLPNAPISSNFTALVMNAVEAESMGRSGSSATLGWLGRLGRFRVPRLAWAAVFMAIGIGGIFFHQALHEQEIAHGILWFSHAAAPLPEPQLFEDFDAIRRLGSTTPSHDGELLAVLSSNP